MSALFGGGDKEEPQAPATEQKKLRKGSSKSTILTGPLGLIDEPTLTKKTLLGQ